MQLTQTRTRATIRAMSLPKQMRAVVTGAGSGLGRAFCLEIARRGGRVVAADIDLDAARATVAMIAASESHAVHCDVTLLQDVERLARESEQLLGGIDLVINNAGVAVGGRVGEIPIEDWHWIVGVNLWGVVHGCHVFVPIMRRQGGGHVLNVASTAGLIASPMLSPYNVTKSAVVALSEAMYCELQAEHIGVTVLCPTFFRTNIFNSARVRGEPGFESVVDKLMASAKLQADDVARLALDAVERDRLYALPHRDGRVLWRIKRLAPGVFHRLIPRLMAMRARRRGEGA